jgi:ABC-type phosphonate transport system ATPase subunit
MDAYNVNERNRAGAFDRNVGTARDAYAMNEENRYRGYTTNEIARLQQNQEAEARRSGAYGTNLGAYERQQQYGLRAQGQGFDQAFRNWNEQYNQGRMNATDTYNRMFGLGTY